MTNQEQILRLVTEADPANPLEYVRNIIKPLAIDKLNNYIAGCSDCEVGSGPKTITAGNPHADIMVIGESISEEQFAINQDIYLPFESTKEVEILKKVFSAYNVNPEEIFWVNSVNCYCHKEVNGKKIKRAPSKTEVNNCISFVEYAIDVVNPKVILLLGNIALNLFHKDSISKARGIWTEVKGIKAMPTYHPGYLLMMDGKQDPEIVEDYKIDFCEDIKLMLLYIQRKYPDNNVLLSTLQGD